MPDFHRTSPKMAWLRQCRITNKSTETENCYKGFNRELRLVWNSVYIKSAAFLPRLTWIHLSDCKVICLEIGALNMRTLMDSAEPDRPQRRTALVERELGRYGTESETHFAEVGEIEEVGTGYTFFWNGCKSKERRDTRIGFAIK